MGIQTGEVRYDLMNKVSYHDKDRGEVQAEFIILREPSYHHLKSALRIQQTVTRLIIDMQESDSIKTLQGGESLKTLHSDINDAENSSEALAEMLDIAFLMSEIIDIGDFVEDWVKMAVNSSAKKGLCMLDGKYRLTQVHIENMDPNDILKMATKWAAFFGMPIALQKNESDEQQESQSAVKAE